MNFFQTDLYLYVVFMSLTEHEWAKKKNNIHTYINHVYLQTIIKIYFFLCRIQPIYFSSSRYSFPHIWMKKNVVFLPHLIFYPYFIIVCYLLCLFFCSVWLMKFITQFLLNVSIESLLTPNLFYSSFSIKIPHIQNFAYI